MVAKKGRPTDNPRNIQTRIRMTDDEAEMLRICADSLHKTKTEIVVMGIQKVYADIKK